MDKLPRLRRKPKPPAIETSVDRTSSDTAESTFTTEITSQPSPQKASMRKSPLRNLKLRVNAKRARTHSPVARLSSSPVVAVFSQDGVAPRSVTDEGSSVNGRPRPIMPAFLNTSMHGIEAKFQELTWAERNRLAQGARPDAPTNFRWSSFKQTDGLQRGVMDRYINIKPWNHNRVKLQVPEEEFDYVNASTIVLNPLSDNSLPPLRYIAMQGPTLPSFNYVWRMVAEQTSSPAVIVQLTSMTEGGAIKCNQYFPDSKEDATWDLNKDNIWNDNWRAQLSFESLEELANGAIEKRKLLLDVEGEAEPRIVWHLLYTRWPDYGVPTVDDMDSFFELMTISRDHTEPSNPRIIHCSAGVGRTGTFISLEHLMRELDGGKLEATETNCKTLPDLIYDTVDNLRQQRRCMVQSEIQYRFLYEVMKKLWQDRYGAVLDGHDADRTGNSEPAAKRLEVADSFPVSDDDDST
ncbi:Tyrosine-protein phosphatase 2 [Metarhizium brunneum]|uniref:Protein-tyrosine phosphatase, receptor/non-receptor type n=3 Tax=Metarhizium TaxID=5529 RepID=E9EX42_METRA